MRVERPLEADEINAVLAASRKAIANKTFILSYPGRNDGLEVLMRPDGWPRLVRAAGEGRGGVVSTDGSWQWSDYFIDISHYTGRPAQKCDGSTTAGELVVTYTHTASTNKWTSRADTRGWVPVCNPVFDVLSGAAPATSVAPSVLAEKAVRGFTAAFTCPAGTYGLSHADDVTQTLLIDADSLLPVRWQVVEDRRLSDERLLKYTPLQLRVPNGVAAPQCIP
jgi:hypothetical protein